MSSNEHAKHANPPGNPSTSGTQGKQGTQGTLNDEEHLAVLGYEGKFDRSMSLWANFALGFTYLSPLVGVYSLFAVALSTGGPPSIW